MQTNARLAFQLLAGFLVIVVAGLCLPLFGTVAKRGVQTKNLSNAKGLATGCKLYALDHDGRFPIHLSELEPDYVAPGTLTEWRCVSIGNDHDPKYTMDWLYFGAGFDEKNPPRVLIASPQATTNGKKQMREVSHGDITASVVTEIQYQEMLAETVKQMRALDDARHPAKTTPADAPQK